jgi:ATP-dependent DNA ligase
VLQSRDDRPVTRYFLEVVAGVQRLGNVVLGGELVVTTAGRSATRR